MTDEVGRLRAVVNFQCRKIEDLERQNDCLVSDALRKEEESMLKLSDTEERYERVIEEKDDEIRALYKELEDKHFAARQLVGDMPCCSWGRHWLNVANREKTELASQVLELEERVEKYHETVVEPLEQKVADLQEELQEQYSLVDELQIQVQTQDEDDGFAHDQLEKMTDEIDSLNGEIDDLTEELASAYERIDELKEQYNIQP